jgi:acetolactate synthase-1/2/3 large subunit
MNNITVANYIHRELYKRNIKYVFGYSGGAVLPLLNEFRCNKIKFIKNSTEQCSGFVSEGYSKSKNLSIPGVVVTTSGPGLTNMITPLQNAYSDGSPLVVISGQVPMK